MPIPVECPNCLADLQVKENFLGKKIPCRECGKPFTVTRRASRGGSSGGGRRRRSSGGGGARYAIWGAGVVAFLFAGFLGFTAVSALMRGGGGRNAPDPTAFAPGGQQVDARPNLSPSGAPPSASSRFDLPVQTNTPGRAAGSPGITGPKNPSAGVGLGSAVGVMDYWKKSQPEAGGAEGEFALFSQEPDALPPTLWNVDPDPPPEPIVFAPDRKQVKVEVPNNDKTRATVNDIVFPVVPSAFVSVGQHAEKKDTREVWDLTKPEKVGTITNLGVETEMNALSPDGRYFAGLTGTGTKSIGVWDVQAKQAVVDIAPGGDLRSMDFLGIPRPDRLVAGSSWSRAIGVWELPGGDPIKQFDLGWSRMDIATIAFSPGGRYMVMPFKEDHKWDEQIGIFDLELGELVGSLPPPVYATWHSFRLDPKGFAFSPDGTELAGIFDGWHTSKVFIWRLSDGIIVDHMTIKGHLQDIALGDFAFSKKALPLIWFPGSKRLLAYETTLLDRELATNVYNFGNDDMRDKFPGLRRPIDEGHITALNVIGRKGYVVVYDIPEDRVSKATARVAATVTRKPDVPVILVEQGLPRPASMSQVQWITPQAIAWTVQPDPADPVAARTCELSLLKGTLRQVGLSRTGAPIAVVLRSTARDPFGRIPRGNTAPQELKSHRWFTRPDSNTASAAGEGNARAWIDVYDLAAGQRARELRLTYDGDLLCVSPQGSRCAILQNGDEGLIDVYSTADGAHVAGLMPYRNESDELAHLVVSAMMPDESHLVTLSGTGRLVTWDADEIKAIFAAENASQPASSPGGRYVSYCDGQACYVVETASGSLVGKIPDVSDVKSVAWHPDGSRIALLSQHAAAYYLFTVDVASGEVSAPFPVPVISGHLRWFGDRYVLLDHTKLIDVDQKAVAWSYALPMGDPLPMGPDGRHWFISDNDGKPMLDATELPDRQAQGRLAGAVLAPEFVLQPGGSCSIALQLNHPAIDAATRQSIEARLRDQLTSNKVSVSAGQPVTLQVSVTETMGKTVERQYSAIGRGQDTTISFTLKTATFHVAFISGGQTCWEWSSSGTNDSWFVHHQENESITDVLERNYQSMVKGGFNSVMLPPYVFAPTSANGLGMTQLSRPR